MLQELPDDSVFTVAAIGKFQWPLITMGMLLGGNVRVGLEDNLYERKGRKLTGNGEAVEKVVRLAGELGARSPRRHRRARCSACRLRQAVTSRG